VLLSCSLLEAQMTNWFDDLFGGRDKEYPDTKTDGTRRVSQTSQDRESGGEYPHYTRDTENNWHRSEDKKTHSSSWNANDDSRYSSDSDDSKAETDENECKSFDLFDPGTWM
jgi:hypothetical protein